MSASVIAQPAGSTVAPAQQIRVLQAASAQPQVVHQPQQYHVVQQLPQQLGGAQGNITLIQTASGQLLLQQPQAVEQTDLASGSQARIVINNSSQQRETNYSGNVQAVQLAGGIHLQSAIAAQPVVLQQQTVVTPNQNVIVQTLPVGSGTNSASANVIQLGSNVTQQTHHVTAVNQQSRPTSNQSTKGLLVQIGGQTYRMQGVQHVQVANTVGPAQQMQLQQRHIAPATPSQPVVQPRPMINTPTPIQSAVVTRPITSPTPNQPLSAAVPSQTITLTPSQVYRLGT